MKVELVLFTYFRQKLKIRELRKLMDPSSPKKSQSPDSDDSGRAVIKPNKVLIV